MAETWTWGPDARGPMYANGGFLVSLRPCPRRSRIAVAISWRSASCPVSVLFDHPGTLVTLIADGLVKSQAHVHKKPA